MTPTAFRRIALALPGAVEGAHMGHPDFRVNDRVFASIHPDPVFAMVKLTPDEQERFLSEHPATFSPENGAWGRAGCTRVLLASADEDSVGEAMTLAWQTTAARSKPKPERKPTRSNAPQKRKHAS
jgi:hypothetical protein